MLIVIVVVVAVVVAAGGGNGIDDGPAPPPPTASPTMAPTSVGEALLIGCLATSPVADVLDINQLQTNRTSPQFRAVSWMVHEDLMYEGCTNDDTDSKLWERYALATFYFAVNGPKWGVCGQTDKSCAGGTCDQWWLWCQRRLVATLSMFSYMVSCEGDGKKGWLSDTDICEWYRIWCNENGSVERLDFYCELPM